MTEDIMRTIKTGFCPSLSGRTTLTYHIGWLEEKISFQLHENSSGGLFSKEWVSLERLGIEEDKPISSTSIQSLFIGKSSNTGGFLLAVLLNEGLIKPIDARHYYCSDPEAFKTSIQPFIDAVLEVVPPKKRKKEAA